MYKMHKKKLLILLIVIGLLVGGYFLYQGLSKEKVTILYTNDLQGRILPYEARWVEKEPKPLVGGSAALATCLKGMRYDLLLDAGDFFQGTPEGDFTGGKAVIEVMNELGYDALTIGNHEYDQGNENVKRLAETAQFPFLSANIIDERTGERVEYARPYIIKEIGEIKFGIFGVTTPTSICEGLRFEEVIPTTEECLKELEGKADIIIALTHLGFDPEEKELVTDYQLAEEVPGIDIIFGGHYEKELHPPVISPKYKTIICQTKGLGAYLGRLDLVIDKRSKKIFKHKGRIITLWQDEYPPDERMASLVESATSKVREEMGEVIGKAREEIRRDPEGLRESSLGNWQADLMRDFAKIEIAFQNSFGIRENIPKGEITKRDIYQVSPFGNTLVTMELSGEEIWKTLEERMTKAGILQVSGMSLIYDPEEKRLLEVKVGEEPLDLKKTYSLVTNSYLAYNEEPFKRGRNVKDTGKRLRDLEEEYIKENSPIEGPGIRGRIQILKRESRVFFSPEGGYGEVNRNKKVLVWDSVKGEEVVEPGDLSWPLIDLIRRSEKSIDIASYIFSSNTWEYRELLAANQRGVKIRLFLDTSIKDDEGNPIINPLIEELKSIKPIIEVKVLDPEKIEKEIGITFQTMHEKFGILDGKYLFNGSANIESKANTLYTEDRFFFKNNPSLIRTFQGEFDLLWRNGKWLVGGQVTPTLTSVGVPAGNQGLRDPDRRQTSWLNSSQCSECRRPG